MAKSPLDPVVILIVDGSPETRDASAEALEAQGFIVEVSECGESAISAACLNRPTIIVMDLAVKGVDGFMATRAIRAVPDLDAVYIIVTSNMDDDTTRGRAEAAGCDMFLATPVSAQDLVAVVRAVIDSGAVPRLRKRPDAE
jgi:chemosensory pili system protein ChpA (sensor histidine kinase/response regulator)